MKIAGWQDRKTARARWLAGCLVLGLGACAGNSAQVATGPGTSISESRRTLLLSAADGPVPLIIDEVPADLAGAQEVARLAADGAADYTAVTFTPTLGDGAGTGTRLVLRFKDPDPDDAIGICRGTVGVGPATTVDTPRLHAVFCKDDRLVGDAVGIARGTTRDDTALLVKQTTAALFPGGDGSGESWGSTGVSVFGGVGGGDGGVGVGVGGFGVGF